MQRRSQYIYIGSLLLLGLALGGTLAAVIVTTLAIPCTSENVIAPDQQEQTTDLTSNSICVNASTCNNLVCSTIGYTSQFLGSWGNVTPGQWIYFNTFVTGFIDPFDPELLLVPISGPIGRYSLVQQTLSLYDVPISTGIPHYFFVNMTMPDVTFEVLPSSLGYFSTVKYSDSNGWYVSASQSCGAQFGGGVAWQANQTVYASPCSSCLKLQWCRKLITTNSELNGNTSAGTFYISTSAYSNFTTNYSQLGVKSFYESGNPNSTCGCEPFNNLSFPVGTPTNYIDYFLPGKAVYNPGNPNNPFAFTGGIIQPASNTYCYCQGVTGTPTSAPTSAPPACPTPSPTVSPTVAPTSAPSNTPTNTPTESPTESPTTEPTEAPTVSPTEALMTCDARNRFLSAQIVLTVMAAFGCSAILTFIYYISSDNESTRPSKVIKKKKGK